jgi:hypothetical protein
MTTPRYTTASERLMENANSPASVDATLPPQMLKFRLNRNASDPAASRAGPGNGRSARRPRA